MFRNESLGQSIAIKILDTCIMKSKLPIFLNPPSFIQSVQFPPCCVQHLSCFARLEHSEVDILVVSGLLQDLLPIGGLLLDLVSDGLLLSEGTVGAPTRKTKQGANLQTHAIGRSSDDLVRPLTVSIFPFCKVADCLVESARDQEFADAVLVIIIKGDHNIAIVIMVSLGLLGVPGVKDLAVKVGISDGERSKAGCVRFAVLRAEGALLLRGQVQEHGVEAAKGALGLASTVLDDTLHGLHVLVVALGVDENVADELGEVMGDDDALLGVLARGEDTEAAGDALSRLTHWEMGMLVREQQCRRDVGG